MACDCDCCYYFKSIISIHEALEELYNECKWYQIFDKYKYGTYLDFYRPLYKNAIFYTKQI